MEARSPKTEEPGDSSNRRQAPPPPPITPQVRSQWAQMDAAARGQRAVLRSRDEVSAEQTLVAAGPGPSASYLERVSQDTNRIATWVLTAQSRFAPYQEETPTAMSWDHRFGKPCCLGPAYGKVYVAAQRAEVYVKLMVSGGVCFDVTDEDDDIQRATYDAVEEAARMVPKRHSRGGKDQVGPAPFWMFRPKVAATSRALFMVGPETTRAEVAETTRQRAELDGYREPVDYVQGYTTNFARGLLGAAAVGGESAPESPAAVPEMMRRRERSNQCSGFICQSC